jgi:PAS domain S-box-containing protein
MPPPSEASALPAGLDDRSVFRSLFSAYPDALLLVDGQGRIVLSNPAAASLLGYSRDELNGLSVDALVPDAIRPRHAAYREAYGQHPRPRPMGTQMDLVAKRRDGSEVMVEIALSPLQGHGLPFVVAAIRGIGAYPRVRQALQRARYSEHLAQLGRLAVDSRDPQQLLQQVPAIAATALQVQQSLVYLLDADRSTLRVAGGVGLLEGEAVGSRMPNRPDTPAGHVIAQGGPVQVPDYQSEQRFVVPPAYLAAGLRSAVAVPLTDRGRVIGALTARSTDPRRFGDEEQQFLESLASLLATSLQRAQSEEALNHAQRLESVGQLTGGIAHDFNNLLTVIQGNLQVLEDLPGVGDNEHAQQLLGAAMRASRRGAELTGKLLAFSRRQVLQPGTVDVATLLQSLADMLRRTLDQRVRIEVVAPAAQHDDPALRCHADPGQLESALLNIAINARDAMPEGGLLRFTATHAAQLPPDPAGAGADDENSAPAAAGYVALSVKDSGHGMSDEVKERAFEPFFTTKAAGRGTGLGLSTVYGFVKQSRGGIAIDSAPGAGTTVTLYIPAVATDSAADDEDAGVAGTVPAGLRVLLVEDDPEVRQVVQRFLQGLECRITACSSAEQALLALQGDQVFDLLLSDIALGPGMRGTELAHQAQASRPSMAVLLMSGFSEELLQADRESPPGWELLRKPYGREELADAIARLCGG